MRLLVDASLLVYLNVRLPGDEAEAVDRFWLGLVREHELYTDVLVLDEVLHVSARKYSVPLEETIEFVDKAVLPYVDVLELGLDEYLEAKRLMLEHGLKPSDALHAAAVLVNGLDGVASEDRDFDRAGVKRVWLR